MITGSASPLIPVGGGGPGADTRGPADFGLARDAAPERRRAGAVIHRVRKFVRRGDSQVVAVDANDMVRETLALLDHNIRRLRRAL
jgi:hypothetical protein